MHKRRATDGYVAMRFVELRASWVSLTSRTKITILLSRSFFCDKTLGRRDNVTDHCTSDSQCHSLSSQSHFVHKMRDSVGLFQCRCYLDSSAATKTTVSNVNNQSWAELVFLFHTHTYSPTGVTERGFVSQTNLNSTKNTSDLLRFDRGPR